MPEVHVRRTTARAAHPFTAALLEHTVAVVVGTLEESANEIGDLIRGGVEGEVPSFEHMDFGARHVALV